MDGYSILSGRVKRRRGFQSNKENNLKPLVSVLIPAKNSAKTLIRAVNSVIDQSYKNIEVIISVNGSSDNTLEVAQSIEDKRVSVIESQEGIVPALNSCLKASKGKYIARQDADDEWLPEKLSKQIEILESSNINVLGTQMIVREETGEETITRYPVEHSECCNWLINGRNPIGHPSVVFCSSLMEKVGGYWELFPFAEDMDLWMRSIPHANFKNIDIPLNIYNHVHNPKYNPSIPLFVRDFYSQIYRIKS